MYQADETRYERMEYRRAGRSGIKMPKVSLGLWQNFGLEYPLEHQRDILLAAFDNGVTHFDLANNYGHPARGLAEENFGKILKSDLMPYREQLLISTKAGYDFWPGPYGDWGSRKYLISSLDASLRRLGLDYVDIFYHHRPDPETPLEETMTALSDIVRSGKALYVGLSNYYEPEQAARALQLLKDMNTPCLLHQPRYNMLERQVEEKGLLQLFDAFGAGTIAYSPLAQGALSGKYLKGIPGDSRAARANTTVGGRYLSQENLTRMQQLHSLAEERGQSMAQMALSWVLRRPEVSSVLIGARSTEQLLDSLACLKRQDFSEDELRRIDEVFQ